MCGAAQLSLEPSRYVSAWKAPRKEYSLRLLRHVLGFAVGLGLFAVAVPLGLYELSKGIDGLLGLERFGPPALRFALALPLLLLGLAFVLWSNLSLVTRGRGGPADGFGVAISPRTENLVVSGPYRYTRNPMVFGVLSAYFSISLFLGSSGGLVALAILTPLFVFYLRRVEEQRLLVDFGEEFEEYRRNVSMIIPRPPRRR
jgi:protein-S-isoprenylcysteine O-methyltransferase Ste14